MSRIKCVWCWAGIWLRKYQQWTNNSDKFVEGLPEAHLNPTPTLNLREENAIAREPDRNTTICCILWTRFWVVESIAQHEKIHITDCERKSKTTHLPEQIFPETMLLLSSHAWWLIVWVPKTHGFDFIITMCIWENVPRSSVFLPWGSMKMRLHS